MLKTIAHRGNFTIARQELEDSYGIYNEVTKKWNGIIEKLANHKTDLGLGEFSITEERLRVIDFSEPIIISQAKYYVKKPDEKVFHWTVYYKVILQSIIYSCIKIFSLSNMRRLS